MPSMLSTARRAGRAARFGLRRFFASREPPQRSQDQRGSDGVKQRRVVVCLDGSKHSDTALDFCLKKLFRTDDHIDLLHVYEHVNLPWKEGSSSLDDVIIGIGNLRGLQRRVDEIAREQGEAVTQTASQRCREAGFANTIETVIGGRPTHAICAHTEDFDPSNTIVVMASRGKTTMQRIMLGSVSQYCVTNLEPPVLLVKTDRLVGADTMAGTANTPSRGKGSE